ncbi:MAG: fibronectin type III domain-containing protein [Planctomycetes bacterium]|nr:fibronectin type III domain-containing protein [Planctomycetota bacterium]
MRKVFQCPINNGPTNLIVTATSSSQIAFEFLDNSDNEEGFAVERKTEIYGTYETIAYIVPISSDTGSGIPIISYDKIVSPNTTYYYRVRAYNDVGNSPYSNEANALTWMQTPTSLQATPVSISQIDISWLNNTTNQDGLVIERKASYGDFAQIATVYANTTSYSDTTLISDTRYDYRVKAYRTGNSSGYSGVTNTVTIRLTVPYLSGIVTEYYNQGLITDYSVYQTLLGYLSSAHSSAGQGDLVSYVSYLNAFNDKVITETGTTINQNAGLALLGMGLQVKELKAGIRGIDAKSDPITYIPVCHVITFTATVTPTNTPGEYKWVITPTGTDKLRFESPDAGTFDPDNPVTPTIAVHGLKWSDATNDIGIIFVFTSTPNGNVISTTYNSTVITTSFSSEPILTMANPQTPTVIADATVVTITGSAFVISSTATISTTPVFDSYCKQWELGYIQNVISDTILYTYQGITPIKGTQINLALLDSFPDELVLYGNKFTSNNQSLKPQWFRDTPSCTLSWNYLGTGEPLQSFYRYAEFIVWLVAYNKTTKEIRYLRWWRWKLVHDIVFDTTKPLPPNGTVQARTTIKETSTVGQINSGNDKGNWESLSLQKNPPVIEPPLANDPITWQWGWQ